MTTIDSEIAAYQRLRGIVARLRAPDGCPWDREQTHASLRPYLIEEAYEVLATLDEGDMAAMPEELGDLLFQITLHVQLAEEAGVFSMREVLDGLSDKLMRRHPHVFGDTQLATSAEVIEQWDELKRGEREPDSSVLASVPRAMPALVLAQTLLRKTASVGFEWPERRDVLVKLAEELQELDNAPSKEQAAEEFGDVLLNLANYARYLEIDAEEALRGAATKFRTRFEQVESETVGAGRSIKDTPAEELLRLWSQAKQRQV